jgi:drug/metabolite transporter (DMT)-like permease
VDHFVAIGVLAAFCWAAGTVVSTLVKLPAKRPVSAGWQMTFGGAALLALSAGSGEWTRLNLSAITPSVVAAMAYLVIFASLIAFSAYVYLLQREPTGRVASYAYVNPVVALAVGAGFGGESLSGKQYVACLAIIVGVAVTLLGKQAAQPRIR